MTRLAVVAVCLPLAALVAGAGQRARQPHRPGRIERPGLGRPVGPVRPGVAADLELRAECSARRPGVTRLVAKWTGGPADRRRARDRRVDVTVHKGGFDQGLAATLWPLRQGRRLRPLQREALPPRFFRTALALRARSLGSEDGRIRLELEAPQTGLNYFVRVLEYDDGGWVPGPTRYVGIPTCVSEGSEDEEVRRRRPRRSRARPRAARSDVPSSREGIERRPQLRGLSGDIDFALFEYSTVSTQVAEINPDAAVPDPASTGGRINRLASDASRTAWYAASEWGGLYKSVDAGVHWDRLDGHRPQATWDVAVDPLDAQRVYATSFFDGRVSSRAGISVSTDGGATWTRPATATPPEGFCDPDRAAQPSAFGIAIDPDDSESVWIGTNCGLAHSVDAGLTWSFVDPTPDDPPDAVWDVAVHGGLVDTLGFDGQRRSDDGGVSWQGPSGFAVPSGSAGRLVVSPDEDHVLFAAVGLFLWESVDGGASWSSAIDPPGKNQGRVPFVRINDRGGPGYDLWYGDVTLVRTACATPANPAPGGPSRCSYQPGAWQTDLQGGAHVDVGDVIFDPTAGADACPVLFSNDGGVHRNALAANPACHSPEWENPARSPHALWLFALRASTFSNAQETFRTLLMGTQDNRAFVSFDPDEASPSWTPRLGGDVFDIVPREGGLVVARCCRPGGAELLLTGTTLAGAAEIATYPPGYASGFAYGDIVDRIGAAGHVMATSEGVWLTSDITQSPVQWTALGPASFPVASVPFRKIRVRGSGSGTRIYLQLGGNDGHTADEVWRYDGDGPGGTWEPVLPPGGSGGFSVFDASPTSPDRIVACHLDPVEGPAMVRSNDGGATWEPLPALDALMRASGAILYQNQHGPAKLKSLSGYPQPTFVRFLTLSTILAGAADAGLFVSADVGAHWERVRNPLHVLNPTPHLTRPRVADLRFRFDTALTNHYYFYVGTRGRGVFRIAASVPKGPLLDICELYPSICFPIERVPPFQFVLRPRTPRDLFGGPLGDHCPAEGCPAFPGGDRAAFVTLYLDGLSPDAWEVRLFDPEGAVAPHGVYRTRTGAALGFRPDAATWRESGLARFGLGLTPLPGREGGTTAFGSRLVVSGEPFVPESLDDVVF